MSLLEVTDLVTHIGLRRGTVHAVDGVSFSVAAGESLGVVGESGCGKTMVGNSIMRLLPPGGHVVGGSIRLDGRDLVTVSDDAMRDIRGKEIGMVFQDPMTSLNPTMPIGRQIAEPVERHLGASRKAALARAVEVLGLVGMPRPAERVDDYPHQLSGGLRQRVMIAMALACEPKLLIADEPTTALDVTIQAQILTLLGDLRERLGMALILITHDMGVIAGQTDRTMVMYAGRVAEQSVTEELFRRTRHPYTEALLASIPQIDQDRTQALHSIAGLPPDLVSPPSGCRFAARCDYAQDRCREHQPPLEGSGHTFACFYPRGGDAVEEGDSDAPTVSGPAPATAVRDPVASPAVTAQAGDVLLSLRDVVKEFPVTSGSLLQRQIGSVKAVSGVSLQVRVGETFGLVGESGCGKTTIGRMMVALEEPTSGEVLLGDEALGGLGRKALRRTRADLQIMFQDPYASLDPRMRVGATVREPLTIQRRGERGERDRRTRELLGEVGLPTNAIDRYPHEFSGGQRQRIGLARALALNPRLIVADEPVSALDVSVRSQILNLMKRLQQAHGLTYVVISHDLSVVRYMADRIGVMYLGRLVEIGTGEDIYRRTAHPYTEGLLASIPVPDPAIERGKRGRGVVGELPSPINPPSGCRFRTRCARAQDLCASETPPLRSFGSEHLAACHFPLREPSADGSQTGAAAPARVPGSASRP